jgi:hypothetical protein
LQKLLIKRTDLRIFPSGQRIQLKIHNQLKSMYLFETAGPSMKHGHSERSQETILLWNSACSTGQRTDSIEDEISKMNYIRK